MSFLHTGALRQFIERVNKRFKKWNKWGKDSRWSGRKSNRVVQKSPQSEWHWLWAHMRCHQPAAVMRLWCELPGPAEACLSRDSQASSKEYSGRSHTWAALHDCQRWRWPVLEAESCGSGPHSSSEWWSEPKFFPLWDISWHWLCHCQDLKVFFTPKHDPTHLGLVSTQRAAPWGPCDLLPSSQGARAALVFFLSAGALPMLTSPGPLCPHVPVESPMEHSVHFSASGLPIHHLYFWSLQDEGGHGPASLPWRVLSFSMAVGTNDHQVSILK